MTLSVLLGGLGAAGGTFALRSGHLGTLSVAVPETRDDETSAGALRPFAVSPASSTSATPSTSAPATTQAPPPSTPPSPPSTSATPAPLPPPAKESKEDTPTSSSTTASPKPRSAPTLTGQVLALVNDEREKAGCDPVAEEAHLDKAAQGHSDDMSQRDYFSHDTPEGESFADRITAAGYPKPGAENIAKGATSADQVMRMWMNSSGHRRNILNCSLTKLGVGVATDGRYWTQDFGY
ncbi:CAP domain-containing protein [Amycolatopsis orientalis]|uniref:CAP domain-containing protein n=1 Tax=Amycolatopsis orientalis TaxID=31958 RepID=UPI00190F7D67|nr:CAP domain-containing protein [Amycolatopsis orientalis]